jgi:Amt family ammonium transporter
MNDVFETCRLGSNNAEQDAMEVLDCVANTLSANTEIAYNHLEDLSTALDILFLLFASIVMFTMQSGFAMFCAGSVRRKNVQNTLLKNFLDACGGGLAFFVCGMSNEMNVVKLTFL